MHTPLPAQASTDNLRSLFPGACPAAQFELRNPFRIRFLTALCEKHLLFHHGTGVSGLRRIVHRWWEQKQYRRALASDSQPRAGASLLVKAEWRDFSFNPANTQFESIYAPIFRNGYEPETAVLIDALLPADGVMLDIGANWGHVSLFAASRPGFHGQIHAFEPMVRTYADLVASVEGTRMAEQIKTYNLALADHEGTAHMFLPDGERSGLASLGGNSGNPVQSMRLDSLDLPAPNLMKIDVEGYEANVLRGAERTIQRSRPMIIFESGVGDNRATVLEPFHLLEEQNYRFFLPAFVRGNGREKLYVPSGQNRDATGSVCLALVPFSSSGRFLLQAHANIFACHADRLPEVTGLFSTASEEIAVRAPDA